ncbi:MAG: hydroxymethylglutaryl-CoA synthase, partial [candidate division Zixibacteria bacterium]|nr:hydroxymethylglutaryl-CoA synthase [candidate division Zixibacteria bacterium]
MAGIVGYGAHLPRHRIKVEEIAKVWGMDANSYKKGLMLREKSVPPSDMDTITLAVEATKNALRRAVVVNPVDIGAVYVGSESHPYAVKPSGTTVAEAIGATPDIHCADFEFACKAGSEAMFVALSHVESGFMKYALAIAADTSQGAPSDALEFSAAAGAGAFIMGKNDLIADCLFTHSFMTDTPDFWRREHQFYPQHGSRFTGEEAYFKHTKGASLACLKKANMKPKDFAYAVFHQPNGKFPQKVALELGFTQEQINPG